MSILSKPNRSNLRWLQLCVLLLAFIMLPFGVALAHDYNAFEKRLGQAVAEGEISFDQAAEMLEMLRDADDDDDDDEDVIAELKEEMEEFGGKLKSAVKNGRISQEDAMKRWHDFLDNEIADELKEEVAEGEISEEDAWEFWKSIKGEDKGCDKAKDFDKREGKERGKREMGIGAHYRKLGVSKQMYDGIAGRLAANGIKGETREKVMGAMLRMIYSAKEKGRHGEMDKRVGMHLRKELGLNERQIEAVLNMTRRVAHGIKGNDLKPCDKAATCDKAKTCPEAKINEETGECEKAATCDRAKTCPKAKAAAAKKAKDVAAKRAAARKAAAKKVKRKDRGKEMKDDFDLEAIGKRIKAAIAAGKITEKQGWEKWEMLKKNELKPRLEAAVKAGKMTRDQVRKVWHDIKMGEIGEKLKSAVAKGEMTEKQAKEKWEKITRRAHGKDEQKGEHEDDEHEGHDKD